MHLGLDTDQERQLFHDLNRLGKKVDASLAFQFDSSNPITHFIKQTLAGELGLEITETETKDWSQDPGALVLKDVVAINALAFLNKSNIAGATPSTVEPRQQAIVDLWARISEIDGFGQSGAKEKTVAAQPVVLKALAKIAYDLNFSNRQTGSIVAGVRNQFAAMRENETAAQALRCCAASLPVPEAGGSIDRLAGFVNLRTRENLVLVAGWALAALR